MWKKLILVICVAAIANILLSGPTLHPFALSYSFLEQFSQNQIILARGRSVLELFFRKSYPKFLSQNLFSEGQQESPQFGKYKVTICTKKPGKLQGLSRNNSFPFTASEFSKYSKYSQHLSTKYKDGEKASIDNSGCSINKEVKKEEIVENHDKFPTAVEGKWIVRFKDYKYASEHRSVLIQSIGEMEKNSWVWIERNNPASKFPTDFGLLTIHSQETKRRIESLSFVKDVNPEMKFTRALLFDIEDKVHESKKSYDSRGPIEKPPGRFRTKMSWSEGEGEIHSEEKRKGNQFDHSRWGNISLAEAERRELLQAGRSSVTSLFMAERLWAKGFSGAKVKMAVFDTGVREDHPHFRNIMERTNWTDEDTLNDGLGHGTFVTGVISSQFPDCPGFAPDVEIYAFRVFTNQQVSYTSWFLDAFNYAILTEMNILNLSIGGPDYLDRPFVEKVWEMSGNNILTVSAIGNDGPLYGTLNSPADQSDVIGVGGIDYSLSIASFSSRGMTTWELPHGYGRLKPDIVAYGREVIGSKINEGCKSLSGTSVASPVVAGAVCLLASVVPAEDRWRLLNPASMKQALVEGAARLDGPHMFEQGMGKLDLLESYRILANYTPRASVVPSVLDLTSCPYSWPFCRQPIFHGSMPLIFNATILNGMGVVGWLEGSPQWEPDTSATQGGSFLEISFTHSPVLWPWSGYLGIFIRVNVQGRGFSGKAEGKIHFTVVSPAGKGEKKPRRWECQLAVHVNVVPTPPRERRLLWDQFHSIRYPPGYIPRDNLEVRTDILDWHGDHPHTNFHGLFNELRARGYFLEVLGSPLSCFNASEYGALLIIDSEDEFFPQEIEKLEKDVKSYGLGLIVFAEWYHVETMRKMKFFDDNTRSWWTPLTGGGNIPAVNDLLKPFGTSFGDSVLNGFFSIDGERAQVSSGVQIRTFPAKGYIHKFAFGNSVDSAVTSSGTGTNDEREFAILGLTWAGEGRIALFGDSNCLDSSHMLMPCYWLLLKILEFVTRGKKDPSLFGPRNYISEPLEPPEGSESPKRREDVDFSQVSAVVGKEMECGLDSPLEFQKFPEIKNEGFKGRSQKGVKTSDNDSDKEVWEVVKDEKKESEATNLKEKNEKGLNQQKSEDGIEDLLKNEIVSHVGDPNLNPKQVREAEVHILEGKGPKRITGHILKFGWNQRTGNEIDPTIIAQQWLIVGFLGASGFLLFWTLWSGPRRKRGARRSGTPRSSPV